MLFSKVYYLTVNAQLRHFPLVNDQYLIRIHTRYELVCQDYDLKLKIERLLFLFRVNSIKAFSTATEIIYIFFQFLLIYAIRFEYD